MTTAAEVSVPTTESAIRTRALALVEQAGRVPVITDDETCGKAGDLVKFLIAAAAKWDELRVAAKAPHLMRCREIDAAARGLADEIERAKKATKAKQDVYLIAKERETKRLADEAARIAQEKALEEAAKLEAVGDKVSAERALEAAVVAPTAVHVQTRGDYGSTSSLRSTWSASVTDFGALPDMFKVADMAALNALARTTRPKISGVEWIETRSSVSR